ncbi:MAG TPA: hypothetical protein DCZ94_09405 [Lentisphaeria bacterium]|nr:MAG: hypothetical protein A2X48_18240 [Lentisphaerae bacterium GWF2_49_21]HBC87157.1 hypothetical protein [Lentisphaeria bacterium]
MKYRIVIRAFTLRRDIGISYILAEILRKAGCEVYISCCRNYTNALVKWKPHAVIINTVGAVDTSKRLAPDAKIILWPGEGSEPIDRGDAYHFARLGNFKDIDLVLLWGKANLDAFENRFGKNDCKLKVCGNPKFDLIKFSPSPVKRNTIGIIGRFGEINLYDKKPGIFILMNTDHLDVFKMICDQFVTVIKLIDFIVKNTDFNVSIRPHPHEAPEGYSRIYDEFGDRVEVDSSYEFSPWASRQKMLIGTASSSFLEAYLLKIPVISIDRLSGADKTVEEKCKSNTMLYSMSINPSSFEELCQLVKSEPKPASDIKEIDDFLKYFSEWPHDGSAIKKAADTILSLLRGSKFRFHMNYPIEYIDLIDWYYFWKSTLLGGTNHPNFNYKNGYHKMPPEYKTIIQNVMSCRD